MRRGFMKKKYLVVIAVLVVIFAFALVACDKTTYEKTYFVEINYPISLNIELNSENIDFTKYFVITDDLGKNVPVTEDMLDLSGVDTTKTGTFGVTLTYEGKSCTAIFTVVAPRDTDKDDDANKDDDKNDDKNDLAKVLALYDDYSKWNFVVDVTQSYDGQNYGTDTFNCMQGNLQFIYDYDDVTYVEYLEYVGDECFYYEDNADGTHTKLDETSDMYWWYVWAILEADLTQLGEIEFTEGETCYSAVDADKAGNKIIGEDEDCVYTDVDLYISDGKITKLVVKFDWTDEDGVTNVIYTFEYSKHGTVSFDLSSLKLSGNGEEPTPDKPDDPETPDDVDIKTYTSVFTDKNLSVGAGELTYTADKTANDFENRGVQFTQNGGVAVVTSTQVVNNVSTVTVTMASNATFKASVSVGGTAFLCGGATSVTVSGASVDYTFTTANPVSGKISVTLTPDGTKKSMYISKIAVNGTSNGGTTEPDDPVTPSKPNVMESQTYNPATFDNDRLHAKIEKSKDYIGLPSYGDINVLVIPVQLKGDTITAKQLADLNTALNGTSADTGWESVNSYYKKSSFGALNLTFDIQEVYQAKNNASYYANYYDRNDPNTDGSSVILKEVLAYYDDTIDYSKYDTNGDGCIDAVYLIYSAPVAYQDSGYSENYENLYWAFVNWYGGEEEYDELYAYYYLFAGFDFMDENTNTGNDHYMTGDSESYFTVNASTYIHETGHVLGLDDYYDYEEKKGSNEHLGGADMMDYTVGDQNVYSKIMLGWVTPEIVTSTATVTIESSTLTGDCILIPLNFDNSYFCEYLLIDLYTAEGLNEKHASMSDTYLYDGAEYGVRIYHVSSSINNSYSTDYYSFTDYNNSDTSIALIKLLSADVRKKVLDGEEYAEEKDLWQTGDTLSSIYGSYKRNDGKTVNFDITVTSVSADSATITITFDE